MATIAAGVLLIVVGAKVVGGYGGAAVIGLGIGVAIVGLGRREPHLFRRWRGEDPDAPESPEERDAPRKWPEW
jgi:hypothetical protein